MEREVHEAEQCLEVVQRQLLVLLQRHRGKMSLVAQLQSGCREGLSIYVVPSRHRWLGEQGHEWVPHVSPRQRYVYLVLGIRHRACGLGDRCSCLPCMPRSQSLECHHWRDQRVGKPEEVPTVACEADVT